MKDQTNFRTEFPQFRSPCPTRDEIFGDYIKKEQMINRSPNIKYFSRTNSHWIPPPAKTTNAPKRTKSITNIDASRYRRSRSWSPSEEKIDKRDEEKPRNWAKVVNDIDRSIENLSHSVQGLLKDTKNEKEEIHFEHTPVRDAVSNGEIDRLASELQQTREELHHAETRQASLEALKSHLQLQLRQRSAQCDRIVAHLLNSKSKTRQTVVKLTQQLADADDKIQKLCKQHSLLKQAAKGQKKRAIKAEEEIARLRDDNGENGEKRNVGDTAKAIAHLEQDNKRLRELADSYEERLAIKEKEVEKLRERLSQTNGKDLTIKDGFEKISSNSSRSISPGKTKIEPQSDLPTPLPPSIDKETEMAVTIQDLREKLAQSEASNKNLHAYLAFLKHSYSSIFDDDDEKKDVPATPAFVTVVAPNDVSPGLIA